MSDATHVQAHKAGERGRLVKFVYFVLNESGQVKIGSSWSPEKRLASLQIGSADRLKLIGAIPGDVEAERAWHLRFAQANVGGEWFVYEGELKEAICSACQEVGAFAQRIARLENERFLLSEDIKDVYDEIRLIGLDKAAVTVLVEKFLLAEDTIGKEYSTLVGRP